MTHFGLHKHSMNGLHVIHRSDCFWAGLSPDLVIEQPVQPGNIWGLTREREMSERQQAIRIQCLLWQR